MRPLKNAARREHRKAITGKKRVSRRQYERRLLCGDIDTWLYSPTVVCVGLPLSSGESTVTIVLFQTLLSAKYFPYSYTLQLTHQFHRPLATFSPDEHGSCNKIKSSKS